MPGKSHGQRSLMGYSPWGHKRLGHDCAAEQQQTTEVLGMQMFFCLKLSCEFHVWNSQNQEFWLFLFLSIFCCAISFPRHWVLNVESLPGEREGVEGFAEHENLGYNLKIFFYCIAVIISVLHTVSTPWGWVEDWFASMLEHLRMILFWPVVGKVKKKKKIKEVEREAKKKIRYNSWSIKCWFSVVLNATLAAFGFSVSQRLCHFSWSVFLFPCPYSITVCVAA